MAFALCVLLGASPAWAAADVRIGAPITRARSALLVTTEVLALGAGALVSVAAGSVWLEENIRINGRPDPRVFAANIAIALAVNMVLTWMLLPDLARVTDDAAGTADISFIRGETFRRTRWIALAIGLFAGVLGVGAVIEKNDFGRGQFTMAVGAAGALAAVLTFDVVALLTVRSTTQASRQPPVVEP